MNMLMTGLGWCTVYAAWAWYIRGSECGAHTLLCKGFFAGPVYIKRRTLLSAGLQPVLILQPVRERIGLCAASLQLSAPAKSVNKNGAVVVQLNVAFLLSSSKLTASLRLMGLAERKLKRDEEAEETLVSAMAVFKDPRIKSSLEKLYAEADNAMEAGESCLSCPGLWVVHRCMWLLVCSHYVLVLPFFFLLLPQCPLVADHPHLWRVLVEPAWPKPWSCLGYVYP